MSFDLSRLWSLCAAALTVYLFIGNANADDQDPLPLKRVVAFTSGVAYFDHVGQVEGDQEVELRFDVEDINDLLKSMVARDFDGGRVSAVTYEAREPLARALRTFSLDLTGDASLSGLLGQLRGHEVEVATPASIRGKVVSVETKAVAIAGGPVTATDSVLLLTNVGLQRVRVDEIEKLQLSDARLNAELQTALQLLADTRTSDQKSVSLSFRGAGKRTVAVGYVQEFPVWKATYRLVLEDGEPSLLQGWAIVENTTAKDWEGVQLSLVSGRPISYRMDLYQPLYFDRPLVTPEAFSALRPHVHDQDLFRSRFPGPKGGLAGGKPFGTSLLPGMSGGGLGGGGGGFGGGGGGLGGGAFGEAMGAMMGEDLALATAPENGEESVVAEEVGEFFRYSIDAPVNLKQQQSAMLPIVNQQVKAEKLSIFNWHSNSKHPLHGLRLTNETDLHLMQGPITVFDDREYAGDAQIADVPPKAERLISYALDLDTEVVKTRKTSPPQLVSLALNRHQLHTRHRHSETTSYTIKNSSDEARAVLIEQPLREDRELVSPREPTEKTRSVYRFAVDVDASQSITFDVVEAQTVEQFVALLSVEDSGLAVYLSEQSASEEVKAAIRLFIQRRRELRKIVAARQAIEHELSEIDKEQTRIRKNIGGLDRDGELYARYLKKLDEQETQIEALRPQLAKLLGEEQLAESVLGIGEDENAGQEPVTPKDPFAPEDPFAPGEAENPFG